jgi:hypothetical protein
LTDTSSVDGSRPVVQQGSVGVLWIEVLMALRTTVGQHAVLTYLPVETEYDFLELSRIVQQLLDAALNDD